MDLPNSSKLEIIIPAYRMHSQTFVNVLAHISEEKAAVRIQEKTNPMIWMVGNFVNMRYSLGWVLGLREEDPFSELFFQGKALDVSKDYPSLAELIKNFHHISPLVYQCLLEATNEDLAEAFSMGMAVDFIPEDKLNFIGMCIGREDYLMGQLGLMRKLLDYDAMKYDVNPELKY